MEKNFIKGPILGILPVSLRDIDFMISKMPEPIFQFSRRDHLTRKQGKRIGIDTAGQIPSPALKLGSDLMMQNEKISEKKENTKEEDFFPQAASSAK